MRTQNEGGFALVEAIAALALSAIAATGLMATLTLAASRTSEASMREMALRTAQSVLAASLAEADTSKIPREGKLEDPQLHWTVSLTQQGVPYPGIQQVDVEVTWTTAGKKGATRLAAYRIASPETAS